MAYAALDDLPVGRGVLILPRQGRGHAVLTLATPTSGPGVGDAVQLDLDGQPFSLTVTAAGSFRGAWQVRAVLGNDKLGVLVPAKFYQSIPRATIIRDLLTTAGETPGSIDLPGTATQYVRRAGPAREALAAALSGQDRAWRFQPGGSLDVLPDASTPYGGDATVVGEDPAGRTVDLLPLVDLLPGHALTLSSGAEVVVERVVQHIGARLVTEVHHA